MIEQSAAIMATRSCDKRLSVLTETPGFHHLEIHGNKLPTYQQVLLCHLSHMDKMQLENSTKNVTLSRNSANCVVTEVLRHYQKAHIIVIQTHKMAEKVEAWHTEYSKLMKLNPERRIRNPKVQLFNGKLNKTMPFWPRNIEKKMEEMKRGKTVKEKATVDEDLNM